MKKLIAILCCLFMVMMGNAQSLVLNGTVTGGGTAQDDVLIDIYEYNSPIQALHTDSKGGFSLSLIKGKEYLIVFYKSGFVLQSFSISDSRSNTISNYFLSIDLERDEHSPEGLYFKKPLRRIAPDVTFKYFTDSKFDLARIRPPSRADSVLVLINRAQANQYILIGNMKLGSNTLNTKYSRQVESDIQKEYATATQRLKQNLMQYDSLYIEEDKHQKASMTASGDAQLYQLTETQLLLSERLASNADHYLLEQQQMLSRSRLDEMQALKHLTEAATASDSSLAAMSRDAYEKSKAQALNDRYRARDANRKFELYNRYQVLNYQEYIELLRYKNNKEDTNKVAPDPEAKPKSKPLATLTPLDTSDNLSKMTDEQRTELIQRALEEEKRFSNYHEKEERKGDQTIKKIYIAEDEYEMQMDKRNYTKYFKNGKPITKITFEFETKRKMTDVLNTIRQVDSFGR